VTVFQVFLALALSAASPPHYEIRENHDPNGTGKFYRGREIALVMGHEAAGWLDRPEREEEERPSRLHELLAVKAGQTVADIGAGSGYHSMRLARAVGPTGKVLAVDIQNEMLEIIRSKAKKRKFEQVRTILGTAEDPRLPAGEVDLILLVDVYHEFSHPYEMTERMVRALKPGGRLAFVEYRAEDPRVPIKEVHKMSEKQVIREMEGFPLKHVRTYPDLPWQHLIVFEKKPEAAPDARP
jgi:protein-L-isoaspartate O-methyltransferase